MQESWSNGNRKGKGNESYMEYCQSFIIHKNFFNFSLTTGSESDRLMIGKEFQSFGRRKKDEFIRPLFGDFLFLIRNSQKYDAGRRVITIIHYPTNCYSTIS